MHRPAIRAESIDSTALRARQWVVLGVLVCSLGCATEACAEDREFGRPAFEPARELPLSGIAPRFDVGTRSVPDNPGEPSTSFAPRTATATPPVTAQAPSSPSLLTTTLLQRLNEYRSNNRVRLLTLWQTAGSAVSLQAGRHGEPSLQWSSRTLNRGGATRGLLDHLVARSLGAAGVTVAPAASPRSAATATSYPIRPLRTSPLLTTPGRTP